MEKIKHLKEKKIDRGEGKDGRLQSAPEAETDRSSNVQVGGPRGSSIGRGMENGEWDSSDRGK